MIYNLAGLLNKSLIIESSVEKTSKIIFALKNFSGDAIFSNRILYNFSNRLKAIIHSYQSISSKRIVWIHNFQSNPEFYCHAEELDQVWKNLLNNAIYAITGEGKIVIELSVVKHEYEYSKIPIDSVSICIQDTGEGIPESLQSKIFQPFFTTKNSGDGSGMGLYLCKKIIEKHNGEIRFKSNEAFTIFDVILPIIDK